MKQLVSVYAEKEAVKALRLALTKKNGSTTGITEVVTKAIREATAELVA